MFAKTLMTSNNKLSFSAHAALLLCISFFFFTKHSTYARSLSTLNALSNLVRRGEGYEKGCCLWIKCERCIIFKSNTANNAFPPYRECCRLCYVCAKANT